MILVGARFPGLGIPFRLGGACEILRSGREMPVARAGVDTICLGIRPPGVKARAVWDDTLDRGRSVRPGSRG